MQEICCSFVLWLIEKLLLFADPMERLVGAGGGCVCNKQDELLTKEEETKML